MGEKVQVKLKVVVRCLPPTLSEENFKKQVDEKYEDEYAWLRYWKGKVAGKKGQQVLSRCYIQFKKPETILQFRKDFQGHAYINDKGVRFQAMVQAAPYQKCPKPKNKRRRDPKQNTIHKDAEYKRFVADLEKSVGIFRPSADIQMDQKEAEQKAKLASAGGVQAATMTPLMAYMKKKAEASMKRKQKRAHRKQKQSGGGNNKEGGGAGGGRTGSSKKKKKKQIKQGQQEQSTKSRPKKQQQRPASGRYRKSNNKSSAKTT